MPLAIMSQKGSQNKDEESRFTSLSILLVSTLPGFCANLRSAIFRARKLAAYSLKIHLCESVEQVIDCDERDMQVDPDFVVFGVDIQQSNCIEQVKQNLKRLNNVFLSSGDYCMVINNNVPCFEMGVTWDSLQGLQTAYQMPVINGDTEDEDKCNYLGQRILCLVESVKGMHSGFPLFTASTCDLQEEEGIVARRHLAFTDI